MIAKGITKISINGTEALSYDSTEIKGIPIRKNSTLFVIKPR
jgi:hypothetical protein